MQRLLGEGTGQNATAGPGHCWGAKRLSARLKGGAPRGARRLEVGQRRRERGKPVSRSRCGTLDNKHTQLFVGKFLVPQWRMLHAGCPVRTSWVPQRTPALDEATAVWSVERVAVTPSQIFVQSRSALAGACARLNSALALSRAVDPRMIISVLHILARCLRRRVAVLLMVLIPRQRRVSRLVKSGEEACQTA